MDGNGVHAYKLINAKGEVHYVKFHWKSQQGIKNLDPKQVTEVQGRDYSHMTHDLVTHINKGDFLSGTCMCRCSSLKTWPSLISTHWMPPRSGRMCPSASRANGAEPQPG